MITVTNDKQTWLKYWEAEHEFPAWFCEDNDTWTFSEAGFIEFCENCWKIYELNGNALLYVEKVGDFANIHFSMMRHADVPYDALFEARAELSREFALIFGFVARHNRGLKKICETLGLFHDGLVMRHGETHGKVTVWECYKYVSNVDII